MKTVPEKLSDLGKLFEERNALYGDNYKRFGDVLAAMFPDGIHVELSEDMNRLALFLQIVHKMTRYAQAIMTRGHADSLDDLAVYSQMLSEWDEICRMKATDPLKQATFMSEKECEETLDRIIDSIDKNDVTRVTSKGVNK